MTVTLDLTPAEEAQLESEAARQGVQPRELIERAVKTIVPQPQADMRARLARLDSILLDPDDEQDQKETWEFLKKALDEDRLSYRKFFT